VKILVITHWYRPLEHPRSFRWSALAEHWAAAGHEVRVVGAWFPGLAREETAAGVRVTRAGGTLVARLRRRYGATTARGLPGGERGSGGGRGGGAAGALLGWANRAVWRRVWWPDYACLWYRPALAAAGRGLANDPPDAVVSVSDPFTCHLVGLGLSRRVPRARWLVDVGDPFSVQEATPPCNPLLYRGLSRRMEARVLSRADAVLLTGAGPLASYRRAFPREAGKMAIVPPLLTGDPAGVGGERTFPVDGKLRLVCVGTLYRGVRSPAGLLALFSRLVAGWPTRSPELHFFGNTAECADELSRSPLFGRSLFVHGPVPRERALAALRDADCLVNIGNATANQLPSKLVEYVAAGRPILNLASSPEDTSAAFLRGHPAVLALAAAGAGSLEGEAQALAAFLEHPPRVDPDWLAEWLAAYRLPAVAARYEALLRGPRGGGGAAPGGGDQA